MADIRNEITDEKLDKYFDVSKRALGKLNICVPKRSHLFKVAEDYLSMAKTYYEDAKHFREKGDYINSFAALNYSYGWLDSGARLGVFDVGYDSILFTVD